MPDQLMPFDTATLLPPAAILDAMAANSTVGNKVSKGDLVYNVKDYGALGTYNGTTGSDDTTAILAAVTALQAGGVGGTLFFPPCQSGLSYRCTGALPNVSGMRIAGTNRRTTRVRFVGTDMFTVSSGTLQELIIEGLYISVLNGHMVNMAGGSFVFNVIRDCMIYTQSDSYSIVHQNGSGDFLENWWMNLDMYRPATAAVPGFDILNSSGGANANVWQRCRANSGNCTSSPYWLISSTTTGSYAYDNHFAGIVGEQNPGGLIHLYSNNGTSICNAYDYDATTTYADHVIKVDKASGSTTESRVITVTNAGRRGGTLGSGIQDFYANSGAREILLDNVGNHSTTAVVTVPANSATIRGRGGFAVATNDWVRTGRNTTGNRPAASSAGSGAMFFDTTLNKPIWSDGTNWRDATGTTV